MTRRKGEITRSDLKMAASRGAPGRQSARPQKQRGEIFAAAADLSAAPLTYSLRRGDRDFVVFCFANPEDARPLPSGLVGNGCRGQPAVTLKTSGRAERVAQDECKVQKVSSCKKIGLIDGQRCSLRLVQNTHNGHRPRCGIMPSAYK
jgi:hypothetical protein